MSRVSPGSAARRLWSLAAAGLLVNGLLLAPAWLPSDTPGGAWIAVEAWIVTGLFAALPPRRWSRLAAGLVAATLVLTGVILLADALARMSLARPLNLYLDLSLAASVFHLLAGTTGTGATILAGLGLALVAGALGWLLARLLAPVELPAEGRSVVRGAGIALMVVAAAGLVPRVEVAAGGGLARPVVRLAADQAGQLGRMLGARRRFAADAAATPASYAGTPGLLERLDGRDVILAFVESYGISAVTDPRYAPVLRPRLLEARDRLAAAGLHVATGTLVAPSQGGQSWLGHGSMLSGLWLDDQLRYDLLLAGGRDTLIEDFRRAGYRTAALMPAITMAWPEGERLGYDRVWARDDIDYAGPPLNWVTMPDQFTWSFFERSVRGAEEPPLFAEIGLISSHAPWTPVLSVLDEWERIGDGAVFQRWKDAGEAPAELWKDHDRVRQHYALSVGYALDAAMAYAARYVDDGALLILLGDHQAAPMITGDEAERAVPVHVISGDPELLAPFLGWGFVPGTLPDADRPAPRMDTFRHWFIRAFSRGARGN